VHLSLLEGVSRLDPATFTESEREQMQIYIHMLRTFVPVPAPNSADSSAGVAQGQGSPSSSSSVPNLSKPHSLEQEHDNGYLLRATSSQKKGSYLQRCVVSALAAALRAQSTYPDQFQVVDEYSPFGGAVPVDAVVMEGGRPVAFLEVDGPHHYYTEADPPQSKDKAKVAGKIRRGREFRNKAAGPSVISTDKQEKQKQLRRKDQMKETLYKRKYPGCSFTRIRYDQVGRLGEEKVGQEVAHFIHMVRASDNSPDGRSNADAALIRHTAALDLKRVLEGITGQDSTFMVASDWGALNENH